MAPRASRVGARLPHWLAEQNLSLAFTTYQAGKLFLVGRGRAVEAMDRD